MRAGVPITLTVEDVEALLHLICTTIDDLSPDEIQLLERLALHTRDPHGWAEELNDKRRWIAFAHGDV